MLLYVVSKNTNFQRRLFLRSTWARRQNLNGLQFATVFILGKPTSPRIQSLIEQEIKLYGDIVQVDFIDSYDNLTLKGIASVQWMVKHCYSAKYVIKADDDLVVDIEYISQLIDQNIRQNNEFQPKIICLFKEIVDINRDEKSKYNIPPEVLSHLKHYPPFCLGSFYGYPGYLLPYIDKLTRSTPIFRLEDVFFTGFILPQVQAFSLRYIDIRETWINLERAKDKGERKLRIYSGVPVSEAMGYWLEIVDRNV